MRARGLAGSRDHLPELHVGPIVRGDLAISTDIYIDRRLVGLHTRSGRDTGSAARCMLRTARNHTAGVAKGSDTTRSNLKVIPTQSTHVHLRTAYCCTCSPTHFAPQQFSVPRTLAAGFSELAVTRMHNLAYPPYFRYCTVHSRSGRLSGLFRPLGVTLAVQHLCRAHYTCSISACSAKRPDARLVESD